MRLEITTPYAAGPALASMAAHAVPGLEVVDVAAGTVERLVVTDGGPVPVRVRLAPERVVVESDDARVEGPVRRWLGLDLDLTPVEWHLRTDPVVGHLVAARPGLRVLGSVDGFETAVLTVLGQQVSLAAARTFGERLVRAFGAPLDGRRLGVFPAPGSLAEVSADDLAGVIGLTGARARTVAALARACSDGLRLDPAGAPGQGDPAGAPGQGDPAGWARTRSELLSLPGIGPWTVEYLALRVLRDPDAFPADDLVLRRALGVARGSEAAAVAEAWAPYRGYGVAHLWASTAYRS